MEWVIGFLLGFFSTRMVIRNWKVYKFRTMLIRMCYDWSIRHLDEIMANEEVEARTWLWNRIPGYFAMLFSYKELTLSAWLHEEAIRKLNS